MADEVPAQNPIEFIEGATNILLIAPHGHEKDDKNTGALTRKVAEQSGCYAIVNEVYGRKADTPHRINLNDLSEVKEHLQNEFLTPILEYKNKIVETYGSTWIFWIHGASNKSIVNDIKDYPNINPDEIKVLVGYGQKEGNDRLTVKQEIANTLIDALTQNGLDALEANPKVPKGTLSFCAHDRNNMNQIFRAGEYRDPNVQSIQLEFRKLGCRDTEKNIEDTAQKLVKAISALLTPSIEPEIVEDEPTKEIVPLDGVDDEKVETAYEHLKKIFIRHFQNAMLECGQYLIETFYGGNYELAQEKKFTGNKSLSKLIKRIQQDAEEKGNAPSRTWVYDAVNLAIDNNLFEQKTLPSVYGQLGHSQKVNLTYAPNNLVKGQLAEETFNKRLTVSRLRERIREEKNKLSPDHITSEELKSEISLNYLEKCSPAKLENFKEQINDRIKELSKNLELNQKNMKRVEEAILIRQKNSISQKTQAQDGRIQIDF